MLIHKEDMSVGLENEEQFNEQGVFVYKVNDCEWWGGWSIETIKEEMVKFYSYSSIEELEEDGVLDLDNIHLCNLDEETMIDNVEDLYTYSKEELDEHRITLREGVQLRLAEGDNPKGFFLASTEY